MVGWVILGACVAATGTEPTLDRAIAAYDDDRLLAAAEGFQAVRAATDDSDDRAKADYYGAHALRKAGFRWAAAAGYRAVVDAGPGHPYFLKGLAGLLALDSRVAAVVLGPSWGWGCGRDLRICGGPDMEAALDRLAMRSPCWPERLSADPGFDRLGPDRPEYAWARYLHGVQRARDGDWPGAQASFLLAKVATDEEPLATLTELALARTAYARDQPEAALAGYARVVAGGGPYAAVAQSESAWAHLLLDDPASVEAAATAVPDLQVGADAAAARLSMLEPSAARRAARALRPKVEAALAAVRRGRLTHPEDRAVLGFWAARLAEVSTEQDRAAETFVGPFLAHVLFAQADSANRLRRARDEALRRRAALRRAALLRLLRLVDAAG